MKVLLYNFSQPKFITNNNKQASRRFYCSPYDTVSFSAIKKSKLDPFQAACAQRFKIPLEKLNTREDVNDWCDSKIETIFLDKKYLITSNDPISRVVNSNRLNGIKQWKYYLDNENELTKNNSALKLLILASVIKPLKSNNKYRPELIDDKTVNMTIKDAAENIKLHKDFDFKNLYTANLIKNFLPLADKVKFPDDKGVWVMIPKSIDDITLEKNVKLLRSLSSETWCTKIESTAQAKLRKGNFYIYLVDNKPQIGIQSCDNEIKEIAGVAHNQEVNKKFFLETKKFLDYFSFNNSDDFS